jgi:hypothetical protein
MDVDLLSKVMGRTTSINLESLGYIPLYWFAPFMFVSSAFGELKPIYGGVYKVVGHDEGFY